MNIGPTGDPQPPQQNGLSIKNHTDSRLVLQFAEDVTTVHFIYCEDICFNW